MSRTAFRLSAAFLILLFASAGFGETVDQSSIFGIKAGYSGKGDMNGYKYDASVALGAFADYPIGNYLRAGFGVDVYSLRFKYESTHLINPSIFIKANIQLSDGPVYLRPAFGIGLGLMPGVFNIEHSDLNFDQGY